MGVRVTLRYSIIYCVRSFFLFKIFLSFFHRSLSPTVEVGRLWPPFGIQVFNPFQVPLLNTIILISSGVYFTILQGLEYYEARFTFADRVYGSTFFIATGFHGLHVIVGTIFLMVTLFRHIKGEFRASHHFGFEAAAWY